MAVLAFITRRTFKNHFPESKCLSHPKNGNRPCWHYETCVKLLKRFDGRDFWMVRKGGKRGDVTCARDFMPEFPSRDVRLLRRRMVGELMGLVRAS